jgi:hypothetical protein
MNRRIVVWGFVWLCVGCGPIFLQAQEFRLFDRTVQVHGFFLQGFVYSNENNWLTMNTSGGSGAMTDFGVNVSTMVTDKLRVGAQGFDRNLGQLGQYHPSLDWAVVDYRFRSWLGVRAGKVKTTIGLYNDTQDLDFLHAFALLPQSVYPTDLREATIAHVGGDIYGNVTLQHGMGSLSYTAYAGHRSDSLYSGYPYLLSQPLIGVTSKSYGGLQYGGDLRWNTPLNGLLIGVSRLDEDINGNGSYSFAINGVQLPSLPYNESSKADGTNQFYGEYTRGKLRIDSEYRRYIRDQVILTTSTILDDVRGWYVAGAYRINKRFQVGSYYSHYTITSVYGGAFAEEGLPSSTDTSLPTNHIYDKVVTLRTDLNKYWNIKIEGHFMDGYADFNYPDGFYPQVNPGGLKPETNAVVVKTGISF